MYLTWALSNRFPATPTYRDDTGVFYKPVARFKISGLNREALKCGSKGYILQVEALGVF